MRSQRGICRGRGGLEECESNKDVKISENGTRETLRKK